MRLRIQEPLARQALDSVREVTDYYRRWFASLEESGESPPPEQAEIFDRIRRVRDYLASILDEGQLQVELNKTDANLIVSCAVFSMETVADLMEQPGVNSEEWEHFAATMRLLYSVAIEFASNSVRVIQRYDRSTPFPGGVRRIIEAIHVKVNTGDVRPMPSLRRPTVQTETAPQPVTDSIIHDGGSYYEQMLGGAGEPKRNPLPSRTAERDRQSPGFTTGACIDFGGSADVASDAEMEATPARIVGGLGADATDGIEAELSLSDASNLFPIHVRAIKEPTLRTLVEGFHRQFGAAWIAKDYALAGALLCALVEAIALDLAIRRRHELRLRGTPEMWDLTEIFVWLLEDQGLRFDLRLVKRLMACRHLLAPAVQLVSPVLVDEEALSPMIQLVHRFLAGAGFSTSTATV